jgi:predicted nucleotide-binding protein
MVYSGFEAIRKIWGKGSGHARAFLGEAKWNTRVGRHVFPPVRIQLPKRIEALRAMLKTVNDEISLEESSQEPSSFQFREGTERSNKVFIVHGHDGELKESTARLVAKLGLEPIILHEQANKGRTIIEKFSDHANDTAFAIVLLTADDEGRKKTPPGEEALRPRARQNVIFELGFFFGFLGRGRVCAIYEKGVELPSDLHGVLYVEHDEGGAWIFAVAKEIRAAGYDIDLNKL